MDINNMKTLIMNYIQSEYLDEEDIESFDSNTPLVSSGLIDSISVLQVVDFLEEQFEFEFEPHEVDQVNLNSVEQMISFIQTKKA